MTLDELKAAGEKAGHIESALRCLKDAENKLALLNKYAAEKAGKYWEPELCLASGGAYGRDTNIRVRVPFDYIVRQAITEVIDARRKVVTAGGELPPASEQVQRGRP